MSVIHVDALQMQFSPTIDQRNVWVTVFFIQRKLHEIHALDQSSIARASIK